MFEPLEFFGQDCAGVFEAEGREPRRVRGAYMSPASCLLDGNFLSGIFWMKTLFSSSSEGISFLEADRISLKIDSISVGFRDFLIFSK